MDCKRLLQCILLVCVMATPGCAQESPSSTAPWTPRLFLDTDVGLRTQLGYEPPASDFGASFEFPMGRRVEVQGRSSFSPDRKYITNDGHSISASSREIFWVNSRIGALGGVGWGTLWTSQFVERGWQPSVGFVIRNDYEKPGRFYLEYLIPVGCVWATPSNPCLLQSKRTQGPRITQEWQLKPHLRLTLGASLYHYCAQSNENEPSIPRNCVWAVTEMLGLRFQFPGWKSVGQMY